MPTPELLVLQLDETKEAKMPVLSPEALSSSEASLSSLNVEHLEINESEDEEALDMIEESDFEAVDEDEEAFEMDAEDDEVERDESSSEKSSRQANEEEDFAVAPAAFVLTSADEK